MSDMIQATSHVRAEILLAAPKVIQAVFGATTDYFTYRFASNLYSAGSSASSAALALTVLSPWQWFASVRTLSNSLETSLTIVALYYWPWSWFIEVDTRSTQSNGRPGPGSKRKLHTTPNSDFKPAPGELYISLIAAALACILRPTNLMVWATISITLILRCDNMSKALVLLKFAFLCGSAVLTLSIGMDRAFYGAWVFPPLKFLYFNVVQSLAVFYGKNRTDYYFTEGLPMLLTTALPFGVVGLWQSLRAGFTLRTSQEDGKSPIRFVLALAVTTSVIALSLISHKEVRFIYPLLPMLHVVAARPMAVFFKTFATPTKKTRLALLILGVVANIFIVLYTGNVHQRGVIDVMHYLRHEHENRLVLLSANQLTSSDMTIGFFMPCHSTPWRNHLIYPEIDAWALTCEPPLHLTLEERGSYLDEADVFYADPASWIDKNMEDSNNIMKSTEARRSGQETQKVRRDWPQYLVFFQQLEPELDTILKGSKYVECWRGFNTHWHDDWRRQGDVVVWCLR